MSRPFYDEGLHICEILSQGFAQAKTGNMQLVLRIKVLGIPAVGEDTYDPVTHAYERTIYMPITAKTAPFVTEKLAILGYSTQKLGIKPLDPSHPQHVSLVGQQVNCWCRHEDYQGKMQEKWSLSTPAQAITAEPLNAKQARQLDMLFGKKPAPTLQVVDDDEITDDDIPF